MFHFLSEHAAEIGLISVPTGWLAYVTQFPYSVRRRFHRQIRAHAVRITVVTVRRVHHHIRATVWQATYLLPGRVRTPIWRRRERTPTE